MTLTVEPICRASMRRAGDRRRTSRGDRYVTALENQGADCTFRPIDIGWSRGHFEKATRLRDSGLQLRIDYLALAREPCSFAGRRSRGLRFGIATDRLQRHKEGSSHNSDP